MTAADADAIRASILSHLAERDPGKTICPSEVARALAGSDEKIWRLMMAPIRAAAVRMAREGVVVIQRKGRPVDPLAFKGIYRLRLAETADSAGEEAGDGPGNGSGIRPVHQ